MASDPAVVGFRTVRQVTFDVCDEIASAAIQLCRKHSFKPITVTVVDPSGHVIVQKRMDGCPYQTFGKYSQAKAYTAVGVQTSSREFRDKYTVNTQDHSATTPEKYLQMMNMTQICGGLMAAFPGGVLVVDPRSKEVLCGVGVSGAASDQDEFMAIVAIQTSSIGPYVHTVPSQHTLSAFSNVVQA